MGLWLFYHAILSHFCSCFSSWGLKLSRQCCSWTLCWIWFLRLASSSGKWQQKEYSHILILVMPFEVSAEKCIWFTCRFLKKKQNKGLSGSFVNRIPKNIHWGLYLTYSMLSVKVNEINILLQKGPPFCRLMSETILDIRCWRMGCSIGAALVCRRMNLYWISQIDRVCGRLNTDLYFM